MCLNNAPRLAVVALLLATAPASAEDVVFLLPTAAGRGEARMTGQILDYTGKQLRLQLASGRQTTIAAGRVARIETPWTAQHVSGDVLFEQGKFREALQHYRQAMRSEQRRWAQRKILAQIVWCQRSLGQIGQAGSTFLLIVRSDPTTQYFDAIPLAWWSERPTPLLERAAGQWLTDKTLPAARLMGASWLLPTSGRAKAMETLRRLTSGPDARIALLAEAQRSRTRVVSVDAGELNRWREAVQRLPEPLRAGPYFVLGRGLARAGKHEQAALAFLRAPILYPRQKLLGAEALLAAGEQMEKMDQPREAIRLYRELMTSQPSGRSARDAKERLQRLKQENNNGAAH